MIICSLFHSNCMQQILESVDYCHQMNIVHRDLKVITPSFPSVFFVFHLRMESPPGWWCRLKSSRAGNWISEWGKKQSIQQVSRFYWVDRSIPHFLPEKPLTIIINLRETTLCVRPLNPWNHLSKIHGNLSALEIELHLTIDGQQIVNKTLFGVVDGR